MPQSSLARSPKAGSSAATKKHIVWCPRWILNGTASPKPHSVAVQESPKEEKATDKYDESPPSHTSHTSHSSHSSHSTRSPSF